MAPRRAIGRQSAVRSEDAGAALCSCVGTESRKQFLRYGYAKSIEARKLWDDDIQIEFILHAVHTEY